MRGLRPVCILLAVGLIATVGEAATIERDFDVSPGGSLQIRLTTGGAVQIEAWDQDRVSVRGRYADEGVELDAVSADDSVTLATRRVGPTRGSVSITVQVPRRFDVALNSAGGPVQVRGVEGQLDLDTAGGNLTLERIAGVLDAYSGGGNVAVLDSTVDGSVRTDGGNITLARVTGAIDSATLGGNVVYEDSESGGGPCREMRLRTGGGNIEAPRAACGLDLETQGGNIVVPRAGEYVAARTDGGDIRVAEVAGWVKASTASGDISVTVVGTDGRRDIRLSSLSGDVELVLPAGLDADFDVTLAYTRSSRQHYSIRSDFDLDVRESERWEYVDGSPRKTLYGSGVAGAGTHRIKIETINGNVRIRRAP